MGPSRFVWLCFHPAGKVRVYVSRNELELDLPGRVGLHKKSVSQSDDRWEYGKGKKKFVAERHRIRCKRLPS